VFCFLCEDLSIRTTTNGEEEEQQEEEVEIVPKKVKTKGGKLKVDEGAGTDANAQWSQPQQKALENALIKFPKGTSERWVKIAKCVPEKSMVKFSTFKFVNKFSTFVFRMSACCVSNTWQSWLEKRNKH